MVVVVVDNVAGSNTRGTVVVVDFLLFFLFLFRLLFFLRLFLFFFLLGLSEIFFLGLFRLFGFRVVVAKLVDSSGLVGGSRSMLRLNQTNFGDDGGTTAGVAGNSLPVPPVKLL